MSILRTLSKLKMDTQAEIWLYIGGLCIRGFYDFVRAGWVIEKRFMHVHAQKIDDVDDAEHIW